MAKTRSPNYPALNLRDAITRAATIYRAEHRHPAEREVVVRDLGYSGLNGASLPVLAALTHYGLLEKAGTGLKVTDDAITLAELPVDSPERAQVIRKAAFMPKLFQELHENFGDQLPSDENLRLWLIRKDYNQNAVDKIIRVYRETLELVSDQASVYDGGDPQRVRRIREGMEPPMQTSSAVLPKQPQRYGPTPEMRRLLGEDVPDTFTEAINQRISDDCRVRVLFDGAVTQEAIQKLIKYLELGLDDYPTKKQLLRRHGVWHNNDVDQPVTIIGDAGLGADGRRYVKIEGSSTAIPEDEVEFEDALAKGAA